MRNFNGKAFLESYEKAFNAKNDKTKRDKLNELEEIIWYNINSKTDDSQQKFLKNYQLCYVVVLCKD